MSIYLKFLPSMQPRASPVKLARALAFMQQPAATSLPAPVVRRQAFLELLARVGGPEALAAGVRPGLKESGIIYIFFSSSSYPCKTFHSFLELNYSKTCSSGLELLEFGSSDHRSMLRNVKKGLLAYTTWLACQP